MEVLVTGASGYLGSALCQRLATSGLRLRKTTRKRSGASCKESTYLDLRYPNDDWLGVFREVDAVVHTAGLVHSTLRKGACGEAHLALNFEATIKLAEYACEAGVKKFIFISSLAAASEEMRLEGSSSSAANLADTDDPYAASKLLAERALIEKFGRSAMSIHIIRPAMVYGKNAPGNPRKLLNFLRWSVPLPFGGVVNERWVVSVDRVVDVILSQLLLPSPPTKRVVAVDREPMNTSEILKTIAHVNNLKPRLFAFPQPVLKHVLRSFGMAKLASQLFGDLSVSPNDAEACDRCVQQFYRSYPDFKHK